MIDCNKDFDEVIRYIQPGIMLYNLVKFNDDETYKFALIIKEDEYHLRRISKNPLIEIRLGVFNIRDIAFIVMMAKIYDNPDVLYETYINIFNSLEHQTLQSLSQQDNLYLLIFSKQNECVRKIMLKNSIKEKFKNIENMMSEYIPWSMTDFDMAKIQFMKTYPDAFKLWESMK